jgi:replicative DNA helicase
LFTANSGGGKSICLANLGLNFAAAGLNVVYISLELSEEMIAQRLDQMLTGISTFAWRDHYEDIAATVRDVGDKAGKITIKRMNTGTTAQEMRAFLREYEMRSGVRPDLIIVDYLDLMAPNEKVSADNVSQKDKLTSEQFRDILSDYNAYGASASQQNRAAIDAVQITQAHTAGGLTKINTVDISVSIVLNPTMKAAGDIGFTFTKTRSSDGVGQTVMCEWDNKYLRVRPSKSRNSEQTRLPEPTKSQSSRPRPAHVAPTQQVSLVDTIDKYGRKKS